MQYICLILTCNKYNDSSNQVLRHSILIEETFYMLLVTAISASLYLDLYLMEIIIYPQYALKKWHLAMQCKENQPSEWTKPNHGTCNVQPLLIMAHPTGVTFNPALVIMEIIHSTFCPITLSGHYQDNINLSVLLYIEHSVLTCFPSFNNSLPC